MRVVALGELFLDRIYGSFTFSNLERKNPNRKRLDFISILLILHETSKRKGEDIIVMNLT